jgi:hypothetical protein
MHAPEEDLLRVYLDARILVTRHLDDPTPVLGAWTAQRAVELMLIERGWREDDLDAAYARHEHEHLLALDVNGWRTHLADALAQSTDRSLRVAQALARYREPAGGPRD